MSKAQDKRRFLLITEFDDDTHVDFYGIKGIEPDFPNHIYEIKEMIVGDTLNVSEEVHEVIVRID